MYASARTTLSEQSPWPNGHTGSGIGCSGWGAQGLERGGEWLASIPRSKSAASPNDALPPFYLGFQEDMIERALEPTVKFHRNNGRPALKRDDIREALRYAAEAMPQRELSLILP